jgi:hypothetical protein
MRRSRTLPIVAALSLVAGSAAAQTSDATRDLAGTYTLVAIDGHELPYAPMHEGAKGPLVKTGTLTLHADGTFASTGSFEIPGGQTVSRNLSGTYTRDGTALTLHWTGAGVTTATIEGETFTMVNEGMRFTYRR